MGILGCLGILGVPGPLGGSHKLSPWWGLLISGIKGIGRESMTPPPIKGGVESMTPLPDGLGIYDPPYSRVESAEFHPLKIGKESMTPLSE